MSVSESLAIKTDAASVLADLQRTVREMMAQIPGNPKRPKDLQVLLGVEYKLCWQMLNIARMADPLTISQYVPGITSVRKMLGAARGLNVSETTLLNVERAMKAFQRVVDAHSDDRRGFDSMVASISGGDGAELISLQHRRDAFRNNSQIWGSQVKTYLLQMIMRKAETGTGYDRCYISGKYGLRRLRQNVMPIIHGYRDMSSGPISAEQLAPLDEEAAATYGASVLPQFSSKPIPNFKTTRHPNGYIYTTLAASEIGRKSAVNMVFGGVVRNAKMERDEEGIPTLLCGANVSAPTELVVIELLVQRGTFKDLRPEIRIHSTATGADIPDSTGRTQQFEISEQVASLGPASKVPAVPESPSYQRQMDYVFSKLRSDPSDFDLFRLRTPYPILHTRVRIACPTEGQEGFLPTVQ